MKKFNFNNAHLPRPINNKEIYQTRNKALEKNSYPPKELGVYIRFARKNRRIRFFGWRTVLGLLRQSLENFLEPWFYEQKKDRAGIRKIFHLSCDFLLRVGSFNGNTGLKWFAL